MRNDPFNVIHILSENTNILKLFVFVYIILSCYTTIFFKPILFLLPILNRYNFLSFFFTFLNDRINFKLHISK